MRKNKQTVKNDFWTKKKFCFTGSVFEVRDLGDASSESKGTQLKIRIKIITLRHFYSGLANRMSWTSTNIVNVEKDKLKE